MIEDENMNTNNDNHPNPKDIITPAWGASTNMQLVSNFSTGITFLDNKIITTV
jgi:hypothetical protein